MLDIEAFVVKLIPEPRPPSEVTPDHARNVIRDSIYEAIRERKSVWLFHIGAGRLGHLSGYDLEKGLLQKVAVDLMVEEFELDLNDFTEREELAIDLTKNTVRRYQGKVKTIPWVDDLLFIRRVGHTAEGQESSVSWSASFPHVERVI